MTSRYIKKLATVARSRTESTVSLAKKAWPLKEKLDRKYLQIKLYCLATQRLVKNLIKTNS